MTVPVYAAARKAIADLPEDLQTSLDAVCVLALAESVENQIGGASAVKTMLEIVAKLQGETEPKGDALDDLAARRSSRRSA